MKLRPLTKHERWALLVLAAYCALGITFHYLFP